MFLTVPPFLLPRCSLALLTAAFPHPYRTQATLLASEPSLAPQLLRQKGLEGIVTYSLRGHRSNASVVQAACSALCWLLRAATDLGGDAAACAARLELPSLLADAASPLLTDHPLLAASVADLFESLILSADSHPGYCLPPDVAHARARAAKAGAGAEDDDEFYNLPRQTEAALFHASPSGKATGAPPLLQRLLQTGLAYPQKLELGRSLARLVACLYAEHPSRPGPVLATAAGAAGGIHFISRLLFLLSKPAGPPGALASAASGRRRTTETAAAAHGVSNTGAGDPAAAAAGLGGDDSDDDDRSSSDGALRAFSDLALAQILSGEGCEREARASTHTPSFVLCPYSQFTERPHRSHPLC